jgi:hypothetical protein
VTNHEASHDPLLERLFQEGDLDDSDRAILESCEACAAALNELNDVVAFLDAAGAEERSSVLSQAANAPEPPGAERSRLALQAAMSRANSRKSPWWHVAAAAAAAAAWLGLVGWPMWSEPAESGPAPIFLGEGDVEVQHPTGAVQEYGPFQWRYDQSFDGTYDLLIWDADSEAFDPRIEIKDLEDSTWTPTDENLPERIVWQVRAKDNSGSLVAVSARISAWR